MAQVVLVRTICGDEELIEDSTLIYTFESPENLNTKRLDVTVDAIYTENGMINKFGVYVRTETDFTGMRAMHIEVDDRFTSSAIGVLQSALKVIVENHFRKEPGEKIVIARQW